jgi:UDP-2,4-diacetamido-2,4,6-trideoxy-beta-L-altropyranose hydrolase
MDKRIRLNIRVDSSDVVGSGHVYRCRSVAEEAKRAGLEVRFLYFETSGLSTLDIIGQEFECVRLNNVMDSNPHSETSENCLGISEKEDARAVLKILAKDYQEFLLLDHYGLQEVWLRTISSSTKVKRVLVIQDKPEFTELVDQIQLGFPDPKELTTEISSSSLLNSGLTLGSFIPISQTISAARKKTARFRGEQKERKVQDVLVFLGNSDVNAYLDKILEAIDGLDTDQPLNFSILLTPKSSNIRQSPSTKHVIRQVQFPTQEDYINFMLNQDLVIGAGGMASLERLFLSVPQIVFTIADNQTSNAKSLSSWGVLEWSGDLRQLSVTEITRILRDIALDPLKLSKMAEQGALFIDGWGARRIVQKMLSQKPSSLRLRPITREDASLLFGWVNEINSRKMSLTRKLVSPGEHLDWLNKSLTCPEDNQLYILEDSLGPIGQVRFESKEDNHYLLSYSLDVSFRGLGLSKKLVSMGLERHRAMHPGSVYKAIALKSNPASIKVLNDLGFRPVKLVGQFEEYILD